MVNVPFYCHHCQLDIPFDGINLANGSNITLINNATMCPRCGRPAGQAIPNATYNVVQGQLQLVRTLVDDLRQAGITPAEAAQLARHIRAAKGGPSPLNAVTRELGAESRLGYLAGTIKTRLDGPPAEAKTLGDQIKARLVTILLETIAGIAITAAGTAAWHAVAPRRSQDQVVAKQATPVSERDADLIAQKVVEQLRAEEVANPNQVCPCGSGKRSKRCCGKPKTHGRPPEAPRVP